MVSEEMTNNLCSPYHRNGFPQNNSDEVVADRLKTGPGNWSPDFVLMETTREIVRQEMPIGSGCLEIER